MMRTEVSGRATQLVASIRPVMGFITLAGGLLILAGWAFRIEILTQLAPGVIHTLPNTATAFVAGGIAILAAGTQARPATRTVFLGSTTFLLLMGSLTLFERLTDVDLGFDRILFAERLSEFPYRPIGRFATNSALCLTLYGIALFLTGSGRERRHRIAEWLASTGLLIASIALIGYLYRVRPLYALDRAAGMGLFTAVLIFTLGMGILFARPAQGIVARMTGADLGGLVARKLLPVTILAPVIIGALVLRARQAELVSREGSIASIVILTILTLLGFLLWTSGMLHRLDAERSRLLEQEAAARLRAEEAMEDARRANRAKSEFLAVMSHELRTPLNAISGYVDLIQLGLRGPVTDAQQKDLDRVGRAQRSLMALINDLLNMARVEGGQVEYRLQPVNVADLLARLRDLVAPQIEEKGLTYTSLSSASPSTVMADADKLEQILLNLLTNAIKFTPAGGSVTVRSEGADGVTRIIVQDTGIGIARSQQREIFEPFVQVRRTLTSPSESGVGLGLSISRQLAAGMGGTLEVVSDEGKGATFTLTLPNGSPQRRTPTKTSAQEPLLAGATGQPGEGAH